MESENIKWNREDIPSYPYKPGMKLADPNVEAILNPKPDLINHPPHYAGKFECIDIIEDLQLPFHIGNVFKYLWRAGKKDPEKFLEDCKKAKWYLDRFIEFKEKECK